MQVFVFDEHNYGHSETLNEMFVRRGGVRMHPEPKFVINGLKADEEYVLKLRFELADDYKYGLQSNDTWIAVAAAEANANLCRITELETRRELGAHWHTNLVQFEHLRLTCELSDLNNNTVYVEPNHKYVPVLSVVHVVSNISMDIRFEQLIFVAVDGFSRHVEEPSSYNYSPVAYYHPQYVYQQPYQFFTMPVYSQLPQYQHNHQNHYQIESSYPEPLDSEYIPEYGWNSVLMPERGESVCYDSWELFHHHVWAPREMELEKLYYQTERRHFRQMYH